MGDEVRQALHRVLTANQATGELLTEAGEGDLLTSLRALNKLCANTKGKHYDLLITDFYYYYSYLLYLLGCAQAGRRTQYSRPRRCRCSPQPCSARATAPRFEATPRASSHSL